MNAPATIAQQPVSNSGLDFISVGMDNWREICIRINWLALIVLIAVLWLLIYLYRNFLRRKLHRTITLDGMEFGISNFKCQFKCSHDIQEIAYKLWIELTSRKIAIPLEENDVIVEVYNSWYTAFSAIRELLKSVPGNCLDDASELISVTTMVLNKGLRPNLTKWQAKFRSWYSHELGKEENKNKTPQDIQREFPEYNILIEDMKNTNKNMINFANEMKKIAFSEKNDGNVRKKDVNAINKKI